MLRLRVLFLAIPLVLLACGGSDAGSVFDNADPGGGGNDSGSTSADTAIASDTNGGSDDAEPVPPEDSGVIVEDTSTTEDSSTPTDTAKPPTDTGVACTEMYSKTFGGHCYFPINARYFYPARDVCTMLGAHLVTITSSEEQAAVQTIGGGGDRWIGLARDSTTMPTASSYKWLTSETSTYNNWQPGEPNGTGSCARMRGDGLWADTSCNSNLIAICERE